MNSSGWRTPETQAATRQCKPAQIPVPVLQALLDDTFPHPKSMNLLILAKTLCIYCTIQWTERPNSSNNSNMSLLGHVHAVAGFLGIHLIARVRKTIRLAGEEDAAIFGGRHGDGLHIS